MVRDRREESGVIGLESRTTRHDARFTGKMLLWVGLMAMEQAHCVAALPNPLMLEVRRIQGPLQWTILAEKSVIEDGYLVLLDKPGLGVELAEDLASRFPYIEGHYAIQANR